jgi:hypothetical protein
MQTLINKDYRNNWKAETVTMLNGKLQLSIRTSKVSDGALNTCASVGRVEGNFVSHAMYQDFYKTLRYVHHKRITSKVVETQHSQVDIDALIQEAKEFYHI